MGAAAAGLVEGAPAKVNLTLRVTGRRDDGYHLLDSLVVFADIGDRLTVAPSEALSLTVGGPFGAALAAEDDNLVLRAARALAEAAGVAPHGALALTKTLPLASGIGGGSADAAAALRLLARFWGVTLPDPAMRRLALGLGADVPVCLDRRAVRMAGIGEVLSPVPPLPTLGMVLVNPGVACPTPAIFRKRAEMTAGFSPADAVPSGAWADAAGFAAALSASGNDLEAPAIAVAPVIGAVIAAIRAQPGCLLARMSGSGATCFGLFPDSAAAAAAAAGLARTGLARTGLARPDLGRTSLARADWWKWGGGLYDPTCSAL